MSLNPTELAALADIRGRLQREDPRLVSGFDRLCPRRAAAWWCAMSAGVLATMAAVWAVGPAALGALAMVLALAAPVTALLAAEDAADLRPDEPDATGPRCSPRRSGRRRVPTALT